MKLKEKLAKEYVARLPYTEGAKELIEDDFLAGFEKARAIAAEFIGWDSTWYDNQINSETQKYTKSAEIKIMSLGEEEVEDASR